ncbi:MAG: Holliday junction branch migration protein RuvA [Bacteroidaceae bacterium]|nr:Holliday junction branch migration protein RuvA [Bacteroidaceae bacterium]
MIEFLKGKVDELTPASAVLDCNGVGYFLNITLNAFTAIQGKDIAKLYVYESIREDAYVLFGFITKEERQLFVHLLSVSGVGGNTARMILSAFSPSELCNVIASGNERLLTTVKGLGKKTAQKIIVELKDKVDAYEYAPGKTAASTQQTIINTVVYDEAVNALKLLGFSAAAVVKTVKAILAESPDDSVEAVIKKALKML